jgi:2-dehydro-3-deoxyglucarate aldolase/4-hydroxy-2-oxoheptanedioate aldolase
MIAVETPEAVANIEEILTVDGLDGIFNGPMDLSTSMVSSAIPGHRRLKTRLPRWRQPY